MNQTNVQNNIAVSVICLAYNHEKYIRETLEGFVKQRTNFRFEVLIHDDASTDHTADIIREYAQSYPELFVPVYQTENQYSKDKKISTHFLYPKSRGKYIAYCEGDDYWCDELKLQKQFDQMETHPECSICTHKVQCVNEDGSINNRILPQSAHMLETGVLSDSVAADVIWNGGVDSISLLILFADKLFKGVWTEILNSLII